MARKWLWAIGSLGLVFIFLVLAGQWFSDRACQNAKAEVQRRQEFLDGLTSKDAQYLEPARQQLIEAMGERDRVCE